MKKKTSFIKRFLLSTTLVLALAFSSGVALFKSIYMGLSPAFAYSKDNSTKFDNGDFTSTTSNSKGIPFTANKWTVSGDAHVNKGVIKVDETSFKNLNYGLADNPSRDDSISGTDYNILMFYSKSTAGKAEAKSSEITLSKASFYKISVLAKTDEGALGSVTGTFGGKTVDFANINTEVEGVSYWRTFNFYVATDDFESAKATLTLRYGSSSSIEGKTTGAVFFDNIKVTEIDENLFSQATNDIYNKVLTSLRRNTLTSFTNSDFESPLSNGFERKDTNGTNTVDVLPTASITQLIKDNFDNETSNIATTNASGNASSLLLLNTETETKKVSTKEDNTLKIKQFGLYKLTVLYKTGDLSGTGLNIKIYDKDDADTYKAEQTNLTNSDKLSNYNNFSLATFYIKGSAESDKEVLIDISLGEGKGWAIVDDIKLFPIVTSEYSDTNALDYSSKLTKDSNFSNGEFNFVTIDSQEQSNGNVYPATPSNWTLVGDDSVKSGIIRLDPEVFNSDRASFGYPTNPGFDKAYFSELTNDAHNYYENVLMVRNASSEEVYYKSSSMTLSANTLSSSSYTKISVSVKAVDGKAFIRLVDSEENLLGNIENISTTTSTLSNGWKRYNIYVYNGITEQKLKLQLGSYSNSDFVFFDNIDVDTSIKDKPEDSVLNADGTIFVNMTTNTFANSTGFSGYKKQTTNYKFSYVQNVEARPDATDQYILKITNAPATYQTLISTYTYALTEGKYYEFSVWVKTNFDNINNSGDYGANIEIVTLDSDKNVVKNEENTNKFVNVQTSTAENKGWVKYSIFVLARSTQNVKVCLGIGTPESPVYGDAYFDDLTVQEINSSDYPAQSTTTTIVSEVVKPTTSEDSKNDDNTKTESADTNIWLLISSILLVISLILAIIGYSIRRIPKKKKEVKVDKKKYDKEKDKVDEDAIKKSIKAQKEENIAKLDAEIKDLQKQYDELKSEYEEKTKDNDIIDQNMYANYTKKANKLIEKIDYLKSAVTYLNDPVNIKTMEKKEINKSKKELEQKNLELNLTTTIEDVKVEEKVEKKKKKKLQKFN